MERLAFTRRDNICKTRGMHRGEFCKNIFAKRSTRLMWKFKDAVPFSKSPWAIWYCTERERFSFTLILTLCSREATTCICERDLEKSRHQIYGMRTGAEISASKERELRRRLNGPPRCVIGGLRALIRKYCRRSYIMAVHSITRFPNWNDFALADTLSALATHSWNISSRLYDL